MSVYLVTWNINQAGAAYPSKRQAFLDHLNRYPNISDPALETVRWVSSSSAAQSLTDDLRSKLDDNDRIFVTKINRGENAGWMSTDVWSWISANV